MQPRYFSFFWQNPIARFDLFSCTLCIDLIALGTASSIGGMPSLIKRDPISNHKQSIGRGSMHSQNHFQSFRGGLRLALALAFGLGLAVLFLSKVGAQPIGEVLGEEGRRISLLRFPRTVGLVIRITSRTRHGSVWSSRSATRQAKVRRGWHWTSTWGPLRSMGGRSRLLQSTFRWKGQASKLRLERLYRCLTQGASFIQPTPNGIIRCAT